MKRTGVGKPVERLSPISTIPRTVACAAVPASARSLYPASPRSTRGDDLAGRTAPGRLARPGCQTGVDAAHLGGHGLLRLDAVAVAQPLRRLAAPLLHRRGRDAGKHLPHA